jgi:putative colanic acid biosynthesis glycosyltransferase
MKALPLVSVILVVKNGEKYIDSCIKSIINQTYERIELVIIDGLSTDGTISYINKFSSPKIRLISESDYGIYDAMNKGITAAKGDWIIFLGVDDCIYHPETISSIFGYNKIDPRIMLIYGMGKCGSRILKNTFNWRMLKGNSLNHQCIFYNKNVFKLMQYETKFKLASDYLLNLMLYSIRVKSLFVDKFICLYGEHGISSREIKLGRHECSLIRVIVYGPLYGNMLNCFCKIRDNFSDILVLLNKFTIKKC